MKITKLTLLLCSLLLSTLLFGASSIYQIPGSDPSIRTQEGSNYWIRTYVNKLKNNWKHGETVTLEQDGLKVTLLFRAFGGFIIINIVEPSSGSVGGGAMSLS